MLDSFVLEGVHYWQEYRKCGKSSCRVCQAGHGHGPYWWARGEGGVRRYIGRELPADVVSVRQAFESFRPRAWELRRELGERVRVLDKFLVHEALTAGEKRVLRELGFGEALL